MSKVRKIIDDVRQNNGTEVDLVDKGIVNLTEAPGLCKYSRYFKEASIVRDPSSSTESHLTQQCVSYA